MIKSCDDMIVLQDNYDEFCMKKRNKYMVDNVESKNRKTGLKEKLINKLK